MVTSKKMPKKIKIEDVVNEESNVTNLESILSYVNSEKGGHSNKHNKILSLPFKTYKLLTLSEKDKIVRHTAEIIRKNYFKNQDFKAQIYKFSVLFGNEHDWEHVNMFLECLLIGSVNLDFLTKICKKIFAIIDEEYALENSSANVVGTCLALITEIGAHVKVSLETISGTLKFKSLFFIEFLTSNMLARSNINNETMRIGLVYYFSRVEPLSQINIQKILSRFGQSLLEHVLHTYFCNSKKSDLAFYFIIEHLDDFIFSSPGLAEMSNSVLQNQMLKHPHDFPMLMKKYISYKLKNINYNTAHSLIIHLSFLLKEACEVNQKALIDSMLEITFSFIYLFENKSKDTALNLHEVLGEIISTSKSAKAKEISGIIYDKILSSKNKIDSVNAYKLIHIDLKSGNIYNKLKNQLETAKKPSPLDEILLLAG